MTPTEQYQLMRDVTAQSMNGPFTRVVLTVLAWIPYWVVATAFGVSFLRASILVVFAIFAVQVRYHLLRP